MQRQYQSEARVVSNPARNEAPTSPRLPHARPRALLITATDGAPPVQLTLNTQIERLAQQECAVELLLVLRGETVPTLSGATGVNVHPLRVPLQISLSRARNVALSYALERGLLQACDVIAFPDDDCLYPPGLLRSVFETMNDLGAQVLCGAYAPTRAEQDEDRFPARRIALTVRTAPWLVCSGAMFLTGSAVTTAGGFDERFGLGGTFGSAEDADYAMRVLGAGLRGFYVPDKAFVHHPYRPHRAAQYYEGHAAVLAKHALRHPRLALSLAYRVLVGAKLLARGRLSASAYRRALHAAMVMLFARRSPPTNPS